MIVSLHQPEYLPWLGYFNKMSQVDLHVVFDSVQYRKNYFQNRNRIYDPNSEDRRRYLTCPVRGKGHMSSTIKDIEYVDQSFRGKHLDIIRDTYKKHPYFKEIFPYIQGELDDTHDSNLADTNICMTVMFRDLLDIEAPILRSSDMKLDSDLSSSDLVLAICKEVKADTYLSGADNGYLDIPSFERSGIKVITNHVIQEPYPQFGNRGDFVDFLSIVDMLMNVGVEETKKIVRRSNTHG